MWQVLTVVALVNEIKKVIKLGLLLEIDIIYKKIIYFLMNSLLSLYSFVISN